MLMVGAGFGVEGRLKGSDPSTEPRNHFGDDVIGANSEAFTGYLQRQMPIPNVPGDAEQICRFSRFDFKDWLGSGADPQIATAVEFEAVAVEQVMRSGQVEEIGLP